LGGWLGRGTEHRGRARTGSGAQYAVLEFGLRRFLAPHGPEEITDQQNQHGGEPATRYRIGQESQDFIEKIRFDCGWLCGSSLDFLGRLLGRFLGRLFRRFLCGFLGRFSGRLAFWSRFRGLGCRFLWALRPA
jgi:hypothetical protein